MKPKFHDAGQMPNMEMYPRSMSMPMEEKELEPYYPQLCLHEDALPEAVEWPTGEEYTILIKVKKTGDRLRSDEKVASDFDVLGCAVYNESEDSE